MSLHPDNFCSQMDKESLSIPNIDMRLSPQHCEGYHEADFAFVGTGPSAAKAMQTLHMQAKARGQKIRSIMVEQGYWILLGHCISEGLTRDFLQFNGRHAEAVGGKSLMFGEMMPEPTRERLGALSANEAEARQFLDEFLQYSRANEVQKYGERALQHVLCDRVPSLQFCTNARTPENSVLPNYPQMLAQYVRSGELTVLTGFEALKLLQDGDEAGISGQHRGKPCIIRAQHVFVGAGADGTAKLLLRSFPASFPEPYLYLQDHGRYDLLKYVPASIVGLENRSSDAIGNAILVHRGLSTAGLEYHVYLRASDTNPEILRCLPAGDKFIGSLDSVGSVHTSMTPGQIVIELGLVTETGDIPVDKEAAAQGTWRRRAEWSKEFEVTRDEAQKTMWAIARAIGLRDYHFYDRERDALATNWHHGAYLKQRHVDEYSRLRLKGQPSNIIVLPPAVWADDQGPGSANPLMPISVRASIVASKLANLLWKSPDQEPGIQLAAYAARNGA